MDQAQQLSQRVEKEVRQLIGDLQMQIIVLRSMVELSQQPQPGQQPVPGQPPRNPEPQPVPGQEPLPPHPTPQPAPPHGDPKAHANGRLREVNS
jgi:hypothetical protein